MPKNLPKDNSRKVEVNGIVQNNKPKEIVTSALVNSKGNEPKMDIKKNIPSSQNKSIPVQEPTVPVVMELVCTSIKEQVVPTVKEQIYGEKEVTSVTQAPNEKPEDKRISKISLNSNADEDRNSSESERDLEDFPRNKKDLDLKLELDTSEPERKAIVLQQDSFEDELPYVPTTLPLERSAALPIVPVKQRSTYEYKTCPIERPRSTTPINPSCLEEYCEEVRIKGIIN